MSQKRVTKQNRRRLNRNRLPARNGGSSARRAVDYYKDPIRSSKLPIIGKIPYHNNNCKHNIVLRYSSSTAESVLVTDLEILKRLVVSYTGQTTSSTIISAYRITGVRLSGSGDGSGVSNIKFKWDDDRGPDIAIPFQFPATGERSMFIPVPQDSLIGMWMDAGNVTGTLNVMSIDSTGLLGTLYLDLHFEYLLSEGSGVAGPTVSSSDFGMIYPNLPTTGTLAIVGFF